MQRTPKNSCLTFRIGLVGVLLLQGAVLRGASCNPVEKQAPKNRPPFVSGEFILKLRPTGSEISVETKDEVVTFGIASVDSLNKRYGVHAARRLYNSKPKDRKAIEKWEQAGLGRIFELRLPKNVDLLKVIEEYGRDRAVEYAEPNYLARPKAAKVISH